MSDASPRTDKAYWRSLDRLLDSPALRDDLAAEFPPRAAEAPDAVSRRTVLRLMAASFALAGTAACRRPMETIVPAISPPESTLPGVSKTYATTLPLGDQAYGLLVESHDARPTKIEGNPLHPSSLGAASVGMQGALLGLYDPDRSPRPRRGSEEATWTEFVEFWRETAVMEEATAGAGLAVLVDGYSSPTLERLAELLRQRFPRARWVVHEAAGNENVYRGVELAVGRPLRPVYHLDRATTLLALDGDFFADEGRSLVQARGFARGRRTNGGTLNRLYAAESCLSLVGAAADHRLALASHRISDLTVALAAELQALGLPLAVEVPGPEAPLGEEVVAKTRVLARDLFAAGSRALLMVGRRQPPHVHALALALNRALGAVGSTVTLHPLVDVGWGQGEALGELTREMREGAVSTLVMLGGNPVYTAAADLDFAGALAAVPHSVHLASHRNETSRSVEWHLPEAHFLETWGDARAADGTASVIQPLIAPLWQGRSAIEVLAILARDRESSGYGLVQDTWLESLLGGEDFERRFNRVLHDGVFAESASEPVAAEVSVDGLSRALVEARASTPGGQDALEVVFPLSPALHDGRFANNPWLQELPDPLTRITWDNAALVSPATARRLGMVSHDVVRLEIEGRAVEAPVWIEPGQADQSVALSLGYGRTAAGRVGTGVGVNAYALRGSRTQHFARGLRIRPTGKSHPLAQTQEHWEMEGRDLLREASVDEHRRDPHVATDAEADPHPPLIPGHDYSAGHQWGMAIDLARCVGCNACVVACQAENNIPVVGREQVARGREMHWLRVDRYFSGSPEDPQVAFQPVPCQHCENAPCEQVCPVGATLHDSEGLNAMVYNRCIGTRYCSNNCPYKVRRFNFFNYTKDHPDLVRMAMNPDVTVRSRGVMEKCSYCVQRIHQGKRSARIEGRELRDGDVVPACQETCPAEAIVFGDVNDPRSRVSRAKADRRNYTLLSELHTRPRTSYLTRIRNPNPEWPGG